MTALEVFQEGRTEWLGRLSEMGPGPAWRLAFSALADRLIQDSARLAVGEEASPHLAVVAIGGYGRRELAPFSDVDLIVIPADDADPTLDESVRKLHRALHDAFLAAKGPALSYSYFLQNDANALDFKTRTALLDARLVFGSEAAFRQFAATARESLPCGEFLQAKIVERQAAHRRWNDTPLAVEPNLKEGAGGLRSFQAANWIRDAIGAPLLEPSEAYEQILFVRNGLHLVSGRSNDVWSRPRQAEVADLFGIGLFELISRSAQAAEELQENWNEARALIQASDFALTAHLDASRGCVVAKPGATLSGAAAGIATAAALGLQAAGDVSSSDEIDGPEALYAVASGETTLRSLDRAGLLKRLLPELEACRTLMPDDAVHAYTVFEHSLRTIRNLDKFPAESFYGRLRDGLSDDDALYLGALLHDVGKAIPGRPHSETGAEIASRVAERWRLAPGVAETVRWLVREHLAMARFIGMRDVADPLAVQEFAGLVSDRERLDMLTLLTCADVSAVAPGTWTPAQEAFLRELHGRTAAVLESEAAPPADAETMRKRMVRSLKDHPVDPMALQEFLDRLPAQYSVNTPPALVPIHMELADRARDGEPAIVWDHDRDRNLSEITVCAGDRPGLLSQILGVLYAHDLSVFGLRANTTSGSGGQEVALDTVLTAFGHQLVPPATCSLAAKSLRDVIQGTLALADLLKARGKDPGRRQEHFKFAYVEGSPGILEFQAPRGRGMAFRLSRMIFEQGWDIVSARFGQWAGRGAAAFYVLGPEGRPLTLSEVESAFEGKV